MKYIFSFWLSFYVIMVTVTAQVKTGNTTLNKDTILIGEPVVVNVYLAPKDVAKATSCKWDSSALPATLELLQSNGVTTKEKEAFLSYTITSFDTGKISLPVLSLGAGIQSTPVSFFVQPVSIDPLSDYRDIKPIQDVPKPKSSLIPYLIGGGIVFVLLLLFLWIKHRLKKKTSPPLAQQNAYALAMQKMAQLKSSGVSQDAKTLFREMDIILKKYCLQKNLLKNAGTTNDEMRLFLGTQIPNPEHKTEILKLLQLSNFVQFAKYQPGTEQCTAAINGYCETITIIEHKNAV